MFSDEQVLQHAQAAISHLADRYQHETGIFSSSPSSHTIVRNLVKRMAEGRYYLQLLTFESAVGCLAARTHGQGRTLANQFPTLSYFRISTGHLGRVEPAYCDGRANALFKIPKFLPLP